MSADEREREEARAAIERVRAALEDIPVRTGPGGTWGADLEARLARGDVRRIPVSERETEPPPGEE